MPPVLLALLFSIIAAAGSLYLSLGLQLTACPLCFYQRTFAFALIGVLLTGLALPDRDLRRLCVLALPPAVGGLGVAGFHVYLVFSGTLECPLGIGGVRTAPEQSLFVFALITLSLLAGVIRAGGRLLAAGGLAVLLGLLAAYGATVANPPAKVGDKPTEPGELKTCQKPFKPKG